jgi:hypothetical protein
MNIYDCPFFKFAADHLWQYLSNHADVLNLCGGGARKQSLIYDRPRSHSTPAELRRQGAASVRRAIELVQTLGYTSDKG